MLSDDWHRAGPRYPLQRGLPKRSPRGGARLCLRPCLRRRLGGGLAGGRLRCVLGRDLGGLRGGGLLTTVAAADAVRAPNEDAVEPLGSLLLVHVLRVHQLAGQNLLGLHEHLLLAGRKTLLAVAQREIPDDLRQLEDVTRLHLVAVVLEAA